MKQITENISYLPASTRPLSCDIVFIKTESATWIFDVGLSSQAAEEINKIPGPKNIVLSHFHPDHTGNLMKIDFDNLFVSQNTKKYTKQGTVVTEPLIFSDSTGTITIQEMPSSHAKGCLCLSYQDYAFLGDGTYCKEKLLHHTYNVQLLKAEIDFLERLPCKYVCLSHDRNFVLHKESIILLHKQIYSSRKDNNPEIDVESFFNPDGSVKE